MAQDPFVEKILNIEGTPDLTGLPAIADGGTSVSLQGNYMIMGYEPRSHEFGVMGILDPNFMTGAGQMYYVEEDDLVDWYIENSEDYGNPEVRALQEAFDAPEVEHPYWGKEGNYKLDPTLRTVLEEQMIEGGVPESEVAPSIKDIEESMTDKLKNKESRKVITMDHNSKGKCECWDGYKRVPGTKPCAPGSCEKCDAHSKESSVEVTRSSIPNEHLGWHSTSNEYEEDPNAIQQVNTTQEVANYFENHINNEDGEFQRYINLAIRDLGNNDIIGAQACINNMIEILGILHRELGGATDDGLQLYNTARVASDDPAAIAAAAQTAQAPAGKVPTKKESPTKTDAPAKSDTYQQLGLPRAHELDGDTKDEKDKSVTKSPLKSRPADTPDLPSIPDLNQSGGAMLAGATHFAAESIMNLDPSGWNEGGWSLKDYDWKSYPEIIDYAVIEGPQGELVARDIDVSYDGGTVNTYWQNHGGPGLDERMTDIDRGDTSCAAKWVEYYSPQNDSGNEVPDFIFGTPPQDYMAWYERNGLTDRIMPMNQEIANIITGWISENDEINEALDQHLADNPPEPDWDSMPGGADWD